MVFFRNYETIQVTLKYGGAKGGRLISGMTNKTTALHVLLTDLDALRAHRPKGENIRQEGAAFFLSWPHLVNMRPLVEDSLYIRWVNISKGSPELNVVKEELSIESVTVEIVPSKGYTGTCETNLSPLGPKHTIELPWTEGMSPSAEISPLFFTSDHSDLQKPFTTKSVQGKRPRSDSINEQSVLSPPVGLDGNSKLSSTPLLKRIRTEQHLPIQNSTAEGKLLTITPQQPLPTPPYHTKSFPESPRPFPTSSSMNNGPTPTGPRPPGDRGTISRLSLELSKVRSQLNALKHCEKGLSEELIRLGVPQPKSEETTPSPHDMEARLILLEIELQQERTQRLRAERMLSEVEKECRVPFVVPALFQAFCRISELGHHEQSK